MNVTYRTYKVIQSNSKGYIFEYTKKIICPKDVLWNLNSITFSLDWPEKIFVAFSDLQDYEMTKEKNVFEFVSLWFCNKNKSGIIYLPKYIQICTKFGYICSLIWSIKTIFYFFENFNFYWFYCIYETLPIFEVDYRPCSNHSSGSIKMIFSSFGLV